jgi:hypothetical protein
MKKLLVILGATMIASVAFGQGGILINNNNAKKITLPDGTTGVPVGTPVGLYLVDAGAAPGVGGSLAVSTTVNLAPGILNSGTVQVPGQPAGSTINVQVRAWSVGHASYEAAFATGDGNVLAGSSTTFSIGPLSAFPAPGPATGTAPGWTTFSVTPVPEPSTIALGLLGLGAIALFRRRK